LTHETKNEIVPFHVDTPESELPHVTMKHKSFCECTKLFHYCNCYSKLNSANCNHPIYFETPYIFIDDQFFIHNEYLEAEH